MQVEIEEIITVHRVRWTYGEHSGTVKTAGEEGFPDEVDWDTTPEDDEDYEEIEEVVKAAAYEAILAKK